MKYVALVLLGSSYGFFSTKANLDTRIFSLGTFLLVCSFLIGYFFKD